MKKNTNVYWRIIIFFFSVVVTLLISIDPSLPPSLMLFPLIPLFFGAIYSVSNLSTLSKGNIGLTALNIMMIIRYLVTPFLMWQNGYLLSRGILPSDENFRIAIIVMLLELFMIFIVIQIWGKKFYRKNQNIPEKINENKNFIGTLFLTVCLAIVLIFPSVLDRYTFVFSTIEYTKGDFTNLPLGSFLPLIIQFGIMFLTISVINFNYVKYKINNNSVWIYISILVIFASSSFIVGTSRLSIMIPLLTGMYLLLKMYPNYKKTMLFIFGFFTMLVILISTLVKQFGLNSLSEINQSMDNFAGSLADSFQSYFSGVHNIAVSVKAKELFVDDLSFETIFSDLFSSVIGVSSYFYSEFGTSDMFNYTFYNSSNSADQIVPLIGQGYLYFGLILSPLFSAIFVISMMYFDKKCRESTSVFELYIFSYIALRFGLFFMSNSIILFSFFTNYFLLLYILIFFNKWFVFSNQKSPNAVRLKKIGNKY